MGTALLFNESSARWINLELLPLNIYFEFIYVVLYMLNLYIRCFCLFVFFHASTWYILEEELELKREEL